MMLYGVFVRLVYDYTVIWFHYFRWIYYCRSCVQVERYWCFEHQRKPGITRVSNNKYKGWRLYKSIQYRCVWASFLYSSFLTVHLYWMIQAIIVSLPTRIDLQSKPELSVNLRQLSVWVCLKKEREILFRHSKKKKR